MSKTTKKTSGRASGRLSPSVLDKLAPDDSGDSNDHLTSGSEDSFSRDMHQLSQPVAEVKACDISDVLAILKSMQDSSAKRDRENLALHHRVLQRLDALESARQAVPPVEPVPVAYAQSGLFGPDSANQTSSGSCTIHNNTAPHVDKCLSVPAPAAVPTPRGNSAPPIQTPERALYSSGDARGQYVYNHDPTLSDARFAASNCRSGITNTSSLGRATLPEAKPLAELLHAPATPVRSTTQVASVIVIDSDDEDSDNEDDTAQPISKAAAHARLPELFTAERGAPQVKIDQLATFGKGLPSDVDTRELLDASMHYMMSIGLSIDTNGPRILSASMG
ncbi:hypothetical protein GGI20_006071, partial [Coemansia sp. BCRC 34301]